MPKPESKQPAPQEYKEPPRNFILRFVTGLWPINQELIIAKEELHALAPIIQESLRESREMRAKSELSNQEMQRRIERTDRLFGQP
jgi:hypothetical protein